MVRLLYTLLGSLALIFFIAGCSGGNQGSANTGDPAATAGNSARGETGEDETGKDSAPTTEKITRGDAGETGAPESGTLATTKTTGEDTVSGSTSGRPVPERAALPEFVASPEESGGIPGAADSIRDVRFGTHEGYERVVLDFGSGGAAAGRVPAWTLSSPAGEGYARVYLPGVFSTATTGGDLGGSLVDDYYAVISPDGGLFVDVFATGAFQYRALELSEPGRLAIDFQPAVVDLDFPLPATGGNTVLMSPRPGEVVESPLTVSGYSRNFEAANTIRLLDASGDVLAEETVLANGWTETWGYFEASVPFEDFSGTATLQVGTDSPRDGAFEGVEIPISGSAGGS